MIPIAWKEIRENAKWAVLGLIGASFAMAVIFAEQPADGFLTNETQLITVFGSAMLGTLLGLLQIIPESLRDQWSFLLHRPATRSRLFCGKVLGGLALYIPVMGLPLIAAAFWASRPGHLAAPFDWQMILPRVADILVGVSFYFAGLLIALRPARWYATRAMPIAPAGIAAAAVLAAPEFWHALLVIIGAWLLLGTAAWSAFVFSGEYQPQPRPAKMSLGIILYVGIFVAAGLLIAMLVELGDTHRSFSHRRYSLNQAGEIRIAETAFGRTTMTDLQGRTIEEFRNTKTEAFDQSLINSSALLNDWNISNSYRDGNRLRILAERNDRESWFFIPSAKRFQGFNIHDKRSLGWIGANGHHLDREKTDPFPGELLHEYRSGSRSLVPFTQGLFRVDLFQRIVFRLYTPPTGQSILGATEVYVASERGGRCVAIPVAISTGIVLLDPGLTPEGAILRYADLTTMASVPYHFDISRYRRVEIGAVWPGDRFFVWYHPSWRPLGSRAMKMPSHVVEITSAGKEQARIPLPPLPQTPRQSRWYEPFLAGILPPAVLIIATIVRPLYALSVGMEDAMGWSDFFEHIQLDPTGTAIILVTILILTTTAVVITRRITRRYSFSNAGRRFWTTAAIFLGPVALLTLLSLHQWPALVPCPTCKNRRRVDRAHCDKCAQPFPPQEVHSGDIFDTLSPQGSNEPTHPAMLTSSA